MNIYPTKLYLMKNIWVADETSRTAEAKIDEKYKFSRDIYMKNYGNLSIKLNYKINDI